MFLFICGMSKQNQTKLNQTNQSKPKTIYFVCLNKPSTQTKPNILYNKFK